MIPQRPDMVCNWAGTTTPCMWPSCCCQQALTRVECPNCHDANSCGDYEGPTCEVCRGEGHINRDEFLTKRLAERGAEVEALKIEVAKLKDLLIRAAPSVERAWGLEQGGPRKSRAISVLNAIRLTVNYGG